MALTIKPVESYRDDFTFANSDAAIARFPFPFPGDDYMYSVNMEPHNGGPPGSVFEHCFDVDEHYLSEMNERRLILERDPGRCVARPHMRVAAWDALETIMTHYAADYPQWFTLSRDGDRWTWHNRLLNIHDRFVYGDDDSLPMPPLEYVMRQTQGDFNLLDQRDDDLYMDAGCVTGPADWSLHFDLGMSFRQWHGPVPLAHEMGIFDRALRYLLNIQVGRPARRLNWTLTVNPRLDTSPETYCEWGGDRASVTLDNAGARVYLRVELQALVRMPRSHALMFSIRTYLISLAELATRPEWARRLHRVLRSLPENLADYKGLSRYRETVVNWLAPFDL